MSKNIGKHKKIKNTKRHEWKSISVDCRDEKKLQNHALESSSLNVWMDQTRFFSVHFCLGVGGCVCVSACACMCC